LLSLVVKESPRWLENHGRHEEALASVAAYRGVDVNDTEAREAYQEIADAVAYENSVMVKGFKALFANDELQSRRRLLIACSVQFFQQLGGINAIIYYSGYALTNSLGLTPSQASLWVSYFRPRSFLLSQLNIGSNLAPVRRSLHMLLWYVDGRLSELCRCPLR
jgi:hypothetical protein